MIIKKYINISFISIIAFLLNACGNNSENLYTDLEEKEINEMIAILIKNNIKATKSATKNGFSVSVQTSDMAKAIDILKANGYPKDKFLGISEIFKNDKIVSSPSEDQVKLGYAISQSLAETISNIDGVITARVHVVMSNVKNKKNDSKSEVSCSIFIKHKSDYDFNALVHNIKTLAINSIHDLDYDKVSVVLFPSS